MDGGDMQVRLGVDIGGTFTDVVLECGDQLFSSKTLTTHAAPDDAIIEGLLDVVAQARVDRGAIEQVIHGTTLATNALIERRGAKTALITTRGFRDVIEMRTESRFEQYDLNLNLPDPLLPRHQRFVVAERMSAQGDVLLPLDEKDVFDLVSTLKQDQYESIAVGFIHAYANEKHERRVREILNDEMPGTPVSLSSDVSPQMREYERFNTVAANAYIKPLMKSYLSRLSRRLTEIDVVCPVFLMHSGGGIISVEDAAELPVRLVESGPAGGAVFAAHLAARYKLNKVLSFDMGGTTAKICLIKNQTPKTNRVFEVARSYRFKKGSGMPISIPVIDMVEIGAGGGSIAHVDAMQQIRVGPKSAGSEPGPACFDRGGAEATVTDADLVLGRLDPKNFAGGSIALAIDHSRTAIDQHVALPLTLDLAAGAYGISEIVDENMANAARVHAVENGDDLADHTMIAFGGAAPIHAARLCEKLGIKRLIVPSGAGVGSAIGFLRAPFSYEATKSMVMRLSKEGFEPNVATKLFDDLKIEAMEFVRSCAPTSKINAEGKLFMRYVGQGFEIPVPLSSEVMNGCALEEIRALFEASYHSLFGRTVQGMEIEITSFALNASTPIETIQPIDVLEPGVSLSSSKQRDLFEPKFGKFTQAGDVERKTLKPGDTVSGPAVITEDETTIIVPARQSATLQTDGCIDMQIV